MREFFVPGEQWKRLVEMCRDDGFRNAAVVMLSTGARPLEIKHIEAKHFEPQFSRVVFNLAESKGKRSIAPPPKKGIRAYGNDSSEIGPPPRNIRRIGKAIS